MKQLQLQPLWQGSGNHRKHQEEHAVTLIVWILFAVSPKVTSQSDSIEQAIGYQRTLVCYVEANPSPSHNPNDGEMYFSKDSQRILEDDRYFSTGIQSHFKDNSNFRSQKFRDFKSLGGKSHTYTVECNPSSIYILQERCSNLGRCLWQTYLWIGDKTSCLWRLWHVYLHLEK